MDDFFLLLLPSEGPSVPNALVALQGLICSIRSKIAEKCFAHYWIQYCLLNNRFKHFSSQLFICDNKKMTQIVRKGRTKKVKLRHGKNARGAYLNEN